MLVLKVDSHVPTTCNRYKEVTTIDMNNINSILTSTSEFATKCAAYCSKNCAIKKTFHTWKSCKKGKLNIVLISLAAERTFSLFPSYFKKNSLVRPASKLNA